VDRKGAHEILAISVQPADVFADIGSHGRIEGEYVSRTRLERNQHLRPPQHGRMAKMPTLGDNANKYDETESK
jgi:hypothetical protein